MIFWLGIQEPFRRFLNKEKTFSQISTVRWIISKLSPASQRRDFLVFGAWE